MKPKETRIFNNLLRSNHRGVALIVALGTMILILIVAALAIYLITRGLSIVSGQRRYQSAFEATEGGMEIGFVKVDSAFTAGVDPTGFFGNIGRYQVTVSTAPLFAATVSGAAIKFARGYFGVGQGIAKGGVILYYHVESTALATGVTGETVTLEAEQKKVVGID